MIKAQNNNNPCLSTSVTWCVQCNQKVKTTTECNWLLLMEASVTELKVCRNYTQLYLSRGRWPEKEKRCTGYAIAEILREKGRGFYIKGHKRNMKRFTACTSFLGDQSGTTSQHWIQEVRPDTTGQLTMPEQLPITEGKVVTCTCCVYVNIISALSKIPNHGKQIKNKNGGGAGQSSNSKQQGSLCGNMFHMCVLLGWGRGGNAAPTTQKHLCNNCTSEPNLEHVEISQFRCTILPVQKWSLCTLNLSYQLKTINPYIYFPTSKNKT